MDRICISLSLKSSPNSKRFYTTSKLIIKVILIIPFFITIFFYSLLHSHCIILSGNNFCTIGNKCLSSCLFTVNKFISTNYIIINKWIGFTSLTFFIISISENIKKKLFNRIIFFQTTNISHLSLEGYSISLKFNQTIMITFTFRTFALKICKIEIKISKFIKFILREVFMQRFSTNNTFTAMITHTPTNKFVDSVNHLHSSLPIIFIPFFTIFICSTFNKSIELVFINSIISFNIFNKSIIGIMTTKCYKLFIDSLLSKFFNIIFCKLSTINNTITIVGLSFISQSGKRFISCIASISKNIKSRTNLLKRFLILSSNSIILNPFISLSIGFIC